MSERVLDRVMDLADQMRDQAAQAEQIGRLTDDTVKMMKSAGLIRLLQTKQYQGFEVHPREFAETTMATAAMDPAAGWIVGVVGVHPYQLAYADPKVSAEIWADDVDTWMASPYAPQGVARPVDGGYIFNGRWQFSSGTDHCDWIILGAMRGDEKGIPVMPPQMLHMILPRKDYEIVEDSWNVVGLRGTGSKDVIVKDAFVPTYRTMDATKVMDGTAQREAGMTEPLYLMPWSTMFPLGHLGGDHRHRGRGARSAPGLPAGARRRHRNRDQRRPIRDVRRRRSGGRYQRCPPGIVVQCRPHLRHGGRRQRGVLR